MNTINNLYSIGYPIDQNFVAVRDAVLAAVVRRAPPTGTFRAGRLDAASTICVVNCLPGTAWATQQPAGVTGHTAAAATSAITFHVENVHDSA